MINKNIKYPNKKLTELIIGLAFDTYNELGAGFPERIYHNLLKEKLSEKKINFKSENYCAIKNEKITLGGFRIDIVVENKVIVELKSRNQIFNKDISQVLYYLKVKNIQVGLILCFGKNGVKIKRLIK